MDWTQIVLTLITLGGTLGGVWLGHRWAEDAARQRELHGEAQQAQAVRTLVRLEIDSNLETLRLTLASVSEKAASDWSGYGELTDEGRQSLERTAFAQALVNNPLVPLERLALESQLGALPSALTDAGVRAVLSVYTSMSRLEMIQQQLMALQDEQKGADQLYQGGSGMHSFAPPTPFAWGAAPIWIQFEQQATEILKRGNPLSEPGTQLAPEHAKGQKTTEDDVQPPTAPAPAQHATDDTKHGQD